MGATRRVHGQPKRKTDHPATGRLKPNGYLRPALTSQSAHGCRRVIYFVDGKEYAVDAKTGSENEEFDAASSRSGAAYADGVIYFGDAIDAPSR